MERETGVTRPSYRRLLLRMAPETFADCREARIEVLAPTEKEALEWSARLVGLGGVVKKKRAPENPIYLIIFAGGFLGQNKVNIGNVKKMTAESLLNHYGAGFDEWNQQILRQLRKQAKGMIILQGDPGTGKTSYIRQLIRTLRDTHAFYVIPSGNFEMLSSPSWIPFWADMKEHLGKVKPVLVLEDAESILMNRGPDNRDAVSLLLNIADGLMAHFIQMPVICTLNCEIGRLDAALLRSGRLIGHHAFSRLSPEAAQKLANQAGRTLPEQPDYSLAEIYCDTLSPKTKKAQPRIGFVPAQLSENGQGQEKSK